MLPKRIVVGGVEYGVDEVKDLTDEKGDSMYGLVKHTTLTMKVRDDLALAVKVQALLHETLHALFHQTGHWDIEDEERIVMMLGCQLPKLFRDNPELMKLIVTDWSKLWSDGASGGGKIE